MENTLSPTGKHFIWNNKHTLFTVNIFSKSIWKILCKFIFNPTIEMLCFMLRCFNEFSIIVKRILFFLKNNSMSNTISVLKYREIAISRFSQLRKKRHFYLLHKLKYYFYKKQFSNNCLLFCILLFFKILLKFLRK